MRVAVPPAPSSRRLTLSQEGVCQPEPRPGPLAACQCPRCRSAARRWPAYYAAPGADPGQPFISYECYLESLSDEQAAQLPSSPSGMALRAIREGRLKLRRQRIRLAGAQLAQ